MRFSRHGLGASDLTTHNHSAIPEVTADRLAGSPGSVHFGLVVTITKRRNEDQALDGWTGPLASRPYMNRKSCGS